MFFAYTILGLTIVQRLAELRLSNKNTQALLQRGAQEHYPGHYWIMVTLHTLWILAIALSIPRGVSLNFVFLVLFLLMQPMRYWVIKTLGSFWTTRIISLDEAPLVKRGPYKCLSHPNYLIVSIEIFALPLALGLSQVALVFGVANLLLLSYRISKENKTLQARRIQ